MLPALLQSAASKSTAKSASKARYTTSHVSLHLHIFLLLHSIILPVLSLGQTVALLAAVLHPHHHLQGMLGLHGLAVLSESCLEC